jgi:hypothetical protein
MDVGVGCRTVGRGKETVELWVRLVGGTRVLLTRYAAVCSGLTFLEARDYCAVDETRGEVELEWLVCITLAHVAACISLQLVFLWLQAALIDRGAALHVECGIGVEVGMQRSVWCMMQRIRSTCL